MVMTLLIVSILLYLAIFASKIAGRLGISALLLFIVIGIISGSDGLGGIYFDNYYIAQFVGITALSFILFSGGLSVKLEDIKPVLMEGIGLSTIGVLITAGIVAVFAKLFLGFSALESFLLAAIISSTDAAAVFAVLRAKSLALNNNLKSLLELESGSNDPMAVFMTVGVITLITNIQNPIISLVPMFFKQMLIGALIGYIIGKVTIFMINKLQLEYDGLYPVLTLSTVIFAYSFASLLDGNGFLSVYIAGLTMSGLDFIHKKSLTRFHDGIAWLMQIVIFLMLGLLVFIKEVSQVIVPGLIISMILMFIARPIAVFLTLSFSKFNFREKTMISWVGLRGAAPVVLATFPLLSGIQNAHMIFNIVFFVVLTSIILQGSTLSFLAKILKLDTPMPLRPKYPIEFEPSEGIKSELLEFQISSTSKARNKKILNLKLPKDSLIVLLSRDNDFLVPSGATVLQEKDLVLILGNKNDAEKIRQIFE